MHHYYGVYVHLPLLLSMSFITIFVLRIAMLGCQTHPLFQVCSSQHRQREHIFDRVGGWCRSKEIGS